MTRRKLLPYEHQLVQALNVTEDEYLDFLAAQYDYTQSAAQRGAIVRAEVATVALILTVIGIIFQVVAALFFSPDEKTQRQRRQERFSPRFGFNSSQELAQYGDPVNLVYCSTQDNALGGVRAATELVWSAIESYGSSQFMQLLLVLGAAKIRELDPDRFAFGQLPLKEVMPSKVWIYYDREGRVKYNDKTLGDGRDPTRLEGTDKTDDVCKIMDGGNRKEGYSQAFSPTSLNVFGIYSPIPINVNIQERRQSGRMRTASLGIRIQGGSWQASGNSRWKVGDRFTLVFEKTVKKKDNVAQEAAKDIRYQHVESLDPASTYKIGTAKFRLLNVWGEGKENDLNIDNRNVKAQFECIEAGRTPEAGYGREKAWQYDEADRERLELYEEYLKSPYEENTNEVGGTLEEGRRDGLLMPSLQYIDREEQRLQSVQHAGFVIRFMGYKYDFTGNDRIKWETDIQDRDSEDFKRETFVIDRGGSIAYTKRLYKEFLADKPTLSVKQLRKSYESDLEDLRDLIDEINSGKLDEELQEEAKKNQFVKMIKDKVDELQAKLKDEEDIHIKQGFKKSSNKDGLLKSKGTDLDPGDNKHIKEIMKEIEKWRERKDDYIRASIGEKRNIAIRTLRNRRTHFKLFGRTYSGGIRYVKDKLANLKGEQVSDKRGCREIRRAFKHLIQEKEAALRFLRYVTKNWEMLAEAANDHFYTKCLVKYEESIYQTVSSCNYVKFAIRCRVFRNISGRAKKYGEKDAPDGFKPADNGIKGRIAMFKFYYKETAKSGWKTPPVIFAVRRGADQDNFIGLHFEPAVKSKYEFKIEPVNDMAAELRDSGQTHFCFIQNAGSRERFFHNDDEFQVVGKLVPVNKTLLRPDQEERGPVMTSEWDLFSTRSDSQLAGSFDNGPEFSIVAVTEQQLGSLTAKYNGMSMLALGVYSGLGMQDLRSVTAYVTEGKECYRVHSDGTYSKTERSSSWAPDIFADTILDRVNGIGKYARPEGVDWKGLALAKAFCRNNGLGTILCMDGVISDRNSWRQFWVETAPYSLLEFARIGGRETLIPAVPVNTNGRATRVVPVTALFNQGNILEGSFKEEFIDYGSEVQDLIATVIYRETEFKDVFPRNASVTVSRAGINENIAIRQTFDLSAFVTRRKQAILYGKWMVNQRHWIKRGIEFKTFPTDSPISPGSYVVVDIGLNTWDQLTTGVVLPEGDLDVPLKTPIQAGTYSMLLYRSGDRTVTLSGVQVDANGRCEAAAPYAGRLFVLGTVLDSKRIFRVAEVSMDEEGEVTVRATEYPCERSGTQYLSHVADFRSELFDVR